MQIGFNNDIEYRGKTFHIQTEDRGLPAAQIETQIFHAGAILDTAIIPYQKVVDKEPEGDTRTAKIRNMMAAAHKNFYKKLHAGDYDSMVGLEPTGDAPPADIPAPEEFQPGQDRVPSSAIDVENDPEAFAIQQPEGEAVDLSKLHEHLAQTQGEPSSADSDGPPTMMVSLDDLEEPLAVDGRRVGRKASLPSWSPTGASAWRGCEPSQEDLSIVGLVEKFLK